MYFTGVRKVDVKAISLILQLCDVNILKNVCGEFSLSPAPQYNTSPFSLLKKMRKKIAIYFRAPKKTAVIFFNLSPPHFCGSPITKFAL